MQFNAKSVSVRTGIMLIHIRMSDTALNLFYGSTIQMFSHYRCFIVQMEGLYMGSTPQQEEHSILKEISHYIKLIMAEFSLYTHTPFSSHTFPSFLPFRFVKFIRLWTKVTVSLEQFWACFGIPSLNSERFCVMGSMAIEVSWVIIFTYLPT